MWADLQFRELADDYAVSEPVDIGNSVSIELERRDGIISGLFYEHDCTRLPDRAKGAIAFDVPGNEDIPDSVRWQVESLDPLTLSPSLLCRWCGHHGFIRAGRWESV